MPLTTEQEEKLNTFLTELGDDPKRLNDWERGFLKDQVERYQKYGAGISLSPKQWAVLTKLYEKNMEIS